MTMFGAKEILPPPFDWCEIPAGKVTLIKGAIRPAFGTGQTFEVSAFLMAKYPISNVQYTKFIDAEGYTNKKWWTEDGWAQKESQKWTQPSNWQYSDWIGAEQPVVGISWHEAIAFCLWLSEITGGKILLPTEQQWQRAAQGDDGRSYPWGNEWDAKACNNNLDGRGIGKSSPVRQYEGKGDSPYKVVDMVGNAWEWCLNEYETGNISLEGTKARVLRGGASYNVYAGDFRVDSRYDGNPDGRGEGFSLRVSLWN